MKIGDMVVVGNDLTKTNERHSVVPRMKEMKGKIFKIQKFPNKNTIFLDGYMFFPGDLIPYKEPEAIEPKVFDPEQLNI